MKKGGEQEWNRLSIDGRPTRSALSHPPAAAECMHGGRATPSLHLLSKRDHRARCALKKQEMWCDPGRIAAAVVAAIAAIIATLPWLLSLRWNAQEVVDLYGYLLRNRIIFLNQPVNDQVATQVRTGWSCVPSASWLACQEANQHSLPLEFRWWHRC